jgi:hypothetical protein
MELSNNCPDCGAIPPQGQTCQDCFHQMLYWEDESHANAAVHHLTVLCYYIQHPALYSPEGLREAHKLLASFVERGSNPQQVRNQNRARLNSDGRAWKIKGTVTAHGAYKHPITWPVTAADVVAAGAENYCASVTTWAQSVLETLRASHNFAAE